ncbi:hypothetical protein EJ110_NYTH33062 [Nymphaea thermarum]|nr:hypothetical protein EJ110_NYTH33062 [Nymphaea thermarum]
MQLLVKIYFGVVVSFDSTYKKKKYHLPFASFICVNHLCQSIFCFALLVDEKKETYKPLTEPQTFEQKEECGPNHTLVTHSWLKCPQPNEVKA